MTDEEILDAIRMRVAQGRQVDADYQPELVRPATEDEMRAAEKVIGFPLPPLLRRIYGEIANGGVGPSLGVEGLPGGYSCEYGEADDEYGMIGGYGPAPIGESDPGDPPPLPPGVLFFCDFGCATWSLLDCRHPQGQMWWWEMGDRDKLALTLPQWLAAWLDGRINEARDSRGLMLDEESWHRR